MSISTNSNAEDFVFSSFEETTFRFTQLQNGVRYYVKANTLFRGEYSDWSPIVSAVPAATGGVLPPGVPSVTSAGYAAVSLRWTVNPAGERPVEYRIRSYNHTTGEAGIFALTRPDISATISNLTPGQNYSFQVAAISARGTSSDWSESSQQITVSGSQNSSAWWAGVWETNHSVDDNYNVREEGRVRITLTPVSDDGFFTTIDVDVAATASTSYFPNRLFPHPTTYRGAGSWRVRVPNSTLDDNQFDAILDPSERLTGYLDEKDYSTGSWTSRSTFQVTIYGRLQQSWEDNVFASWGNPTTLRWTKIADFSDASR